MTTTALTVFAASVRGIPPSSRMNEPLVKLDEPRSWARADVGVQNGPAISGFTRTAVAKSNCSEMTPARWKWSAFFRV